MRYMAGIVVLYVVAGWLIAGPPRTGECTSQQRAQDPGACGVGVLIRESLAWPARLR